jgi:hypothetical protein
MLKVKGSAAFVPITEPEDNRLRCQFIGMLLWATRKWQNSTPENEVIATVYGKSIAIGEVDLGEQPSYVVDLIEHLASWSNTLHKASFWGGI